MSFSTKFARALLAPVAIVAAAAPTAAAQSPDVAKVAAHLSADGGPRVLLTSTDSAAATARLVRGSGAVGFVAKTELAGAALDGYLKG